MAAPKNPFPGMNPYFQESWSDVHAELISSAREAISGELPDDLAARIAEHVSVSDPARAKPSTYRPDVAVIETWKDGFPPLWQPAEKSAGGIAVAEPIILVGEPVTERWIQIVDARGVIVTVIEVLSPGNKAHDGCEAYRGKQRDFLAGGANLVEIDFIRGGRRVTALGVHDLEFPAGTCHHICVSRKFGDMRRREVYLCPLREPLPAIRVPLRSADPDVPLALQPLIDRCYTVGRHWLRDFRCPLDPPLPDDEAAWTQERLLEAGLVERGN